MALTFCSGCQREVSDAALACSRCGQHSAQPRLSTPPGKRGLVAVIVATLTACGDAVPVPQSPTPPLPAVVSATTESAAAKVDARARAQQFVARANAARKTADDAVHLDGRPEAMQVARSVALCNRDVATCTESAKSLIATSAVGASAGLAVYLANRVTAAGADEAIVTRESDLTFAEKAAAQAMADAKKLSDERTAEDTKLQAEKSALEAAARECDAAPSSCKPKCDAGGAAYCMAIGARVWKSTPPNLTEAKALMEKACTLGAHAGCNAVTMIDGDIRAAAARVESLWSAVTDVGDELVRKRHQVTMISQVANNARTAQSVQTMRTINAAIVTERYCPARKAFVTSTSVTEFTTRATKHCKDEAPTGRGLSGAEITLTTECTPVYATACP